MDRGSVGRTVRTGTLLLGVGAMLALLPGPAAAKHGNTATVFSGAFPHFSTLFVADGKGFFKKHGLNVAVRLFDSGGAASAAFRGGRADYLSGCDFPTISLLQVEDAVVLAPIEYDTDTILITAQPEIKSLADLKGKKVAMRLKSSSEFFTFRALKDVGLGRNDVEVVNLAPADQVPALVRGDVVAASWWQPFGWQAEEASGGKLKTLITAKGYYTLWCPISTSRKYVEEHPQETVAFLKALYEASQWIKRAPLDEKAALVNGYLKGDLKLTTKNMVLMTYDMTETPEYRQSMKDIADFMLEAGLIKKPIDWSKVLGTQYLRQVDPSLVK